MTPDDPRHGSEAGHEQHVRDGEKPCAACDDAKLRAGRRRTKRKAMGYAYTVSSDAARQRLAEWREGGATYGEIADHVGLTDSLIWDVLHEKRPIIYTRSARTILAAKGHPVTVLGATRRVQALVRLGYSTPRIAAACNVSHDTIVDVRRRQPQFMARKVREGIVAGYEALSMRIPTGETKQERAGITRARNTAERNGWPPPLAWDDIDDPNETPDTGWKPLSIGPSSRRVAVMIEDAEWLADDGMNLTGVLARLKVKANTFRDQCRRAGRDDLYWRLAEREVDGETRRATQAGIRRAQGKVA